MVDQIGSSYFKLFYRITEIKVKSVKKRKCPEEQDKTASGVLQ